MINLNSIRCPLCNIIVAHKKHEISKTGYTLHTWICKECNFVGFEYDTEKQLKKLVDVLVDWLPTNVANTIIEEKIRNEYYENILEDKD